jgi:hypothetical protein
MYPVFGGYLGKRLLLIKNLPNDLCFEFSRVRLSHAHSLHHSPLTSCLTFWVHYNLGNRPSVASIFVLLLVARQSHEGLLTEWDIPLQYCE